jgi:hypothetical protein
MQFPPSIQLEICIFEHILDNTFVLTLQTSVVINQQLCILPTELTYVLCMILRERAITSLNRIN